MMGDAQVQTILRRVQSGGTGQGHAVWTNVAGGEPSDRQFRVRLARPSATSFCVSRDEFCFVFDKC